MLWLIISVMVVIIDQLTKYIVIKNLSSGETITVIDGFFYLTLHKNPGGAWGILQNGRIMFLLMIPVISLVIVYFIIKNKNGFLRFSLAVILGGAIGNYIDRLSEGRFTDFLSFYIGSYPFPVFNAADIAITCGTALLAFYILFLYKEPSKAREGGARETAKSDSGDEGSCELCKNGSVRDAGDEMLENSGSETQGELEDAE